MQLTCSEKYQSIANSREDREKTHVWSLGYNTEVIAAALFEDSTARS